MRTFKVHQTTDLLIRMDDHCVVNGHKREYPHFLLVALPSIGNYKFVQNVSLCMALEVASIFGAAFLAKNCSNSKFFIKKLFD
jgi:hypothetical protein